MRYITLLQGMLVCLALCGIAGPSSAGRAAASLEHVELLAWPEENAESILARAHAGDARAGFMVGLGYGRGLGGFPHAPGLGLAWAGRLSALGAPELNLLLLLCLEDLLTDPLRADLVPMLVIACGQTREMPLRVQLGNSGLADPDAVCTRLALAADRPENTAKRSAVSGGQGGALARFARDVPEHAQWSDPAQRTLRGSISSAGRFPGLGESFPYRPESPTDLADAVAQGMETIRGNMRLARELRTRPAEPRELAQLYCALSLTPLDSLVFFIATDHDPAVMAPDWAAARLAQFLTVQLPELPLYAEGDTQELIGFANMLVLRSKDLLLRAQDPRLDIALARCAHAAVAGRRENGKTSPASRASGVGECGESRAALRAMAAGYTDGRVGFAPDSGLAKAWLRQAGLQGDASALCLLAVSLLLEGRTGEAWAMASAARTIAADDTEMVGYGVALALAAEEQGGMAAVEEGGRLLEWFLIEWAMPDAPKESDPHIQP